MLKFVKFMATAAGRIIRVVAGTVIIWWGWTMGDTTGVVVMALGFIPLVTGIFNLCWFALFIPSLPFKGKDILALPDAE